MSETALSRNLLAPYCSGLGLDIGFGGDAIVPEALTMDLHRPLTRVGDDMQIFNGSCRNLSFFCDNVLDYIYSSHLLEDFSYGDLHQILREWRRVIKPGGLLITNCPDQQKYLAHCKATDQPLNLDHFESTFSYANFVGCLPGDWTVIYQNENFGNYSWLLVVKKK